MPPLTTGQTGHLKAKFLAAFARQGNVRAACKSAGLGSRQTVYTWIESDPEFAAAYAEAEVEATETLEAEAWRRAVKGVRNEKAVFWQGVEVGRHSVRTEYSDTLLIFLLKARAPQKYKEHQQVDHGGRLQVEVSYVDEAPH